MNHGAAELYAAAVACCRLAFVTMALMDRTNADYLQVNAPQVEVSTILIERVEVRKA
jgi:hypothetical protein